jgi:hypothetical protein
MYSRQQNDGQRKTHLLVNANIPVKLSVSECLPLTSVVYLGGKPPQVSQCSD